jgi:MASE1
MHDTIEALARAESRNRSRAEPEREAPIWRLRSFRGTVWSDEKLASVSGPRIALVVGFACVLLGLSVVWRGDASETAAGFWPPAGASLVAMLVLPPRRWGWVVVGIALPTLLGIAFGAMPAVPGLWWAVANCAEPALAAIVLRRCRPSAWLTRGRLLLVFLVSAVVVAPMIGAAIGSIGTEAGWDRPWLGVWLEWPSAMVSVCSWSFRC